MCKINSQWEFAIWLRELKLGLCNNLEEWEGVRYGREIKDREDTCYTYGWFMLMYGRDQHNIVKQFSFNICNVNK